MTTYGKRIGAIFRWRTAGAEILGTFFVFASITGYRNMGAAPTIAILVASQMVFGLAWDMSRTENVTLNGIMTAAFGTGLLICGVLIIASRQA